MSRERPILFSSVMVRAILDGRKTQTRRVVKPQPPDQPSSDCHPSHTAKHPMPYLDSYCSQRKTDKNPRGMSEQWCWWQVGDRQCLPTFKCPYGQPGTVLWVRETWGLMCYHDPTDWCEGSIKGVPEVELRERYAVEHAANWNLPNESARWRPSIHMPRWASRITLEITGVRVERLQEISEEDAKSEGVEFSSAVASFICDTPAMRADRKSAYRSAFVDLWESINGPGSWDANPWVWVIEFRRLEK